MRLAGQKLNYRRQEPNNSSKLTLDFPHFSGHASLTAMEVNDAGNEDGEEESQVFN
ncbi:hypothetical protein GCM10007160_42130 [Litchfieldella qijiaojingensis]|uniref:Uncharacterized protein n=1 Tax=Litchfieldella qijiaojingensis TaxID=980347 RepID=A0ABQ2ZDQ5_9GAMM|nr:hypothetical protein GCM10007160_42130 [Halomonas qijiaojingensis]